MECSMLVFNMSEGKVLQCGHSTIVYNPPSIKPYSDLFGKKEELRVIGYGRDENVEAMLIHTRGITRIIERITRMTRSKGY